VRKRRPWEPTAEDRQALTEHLFYEVQMTFFLAGQLDAPTASRMDVSLRNAQVEAFTLHLGQLVDFFWGESQRFGARRDAYAADYFAPGEWARLRPGRPSILEKALRDRAGWNITHLTYDRQTFRPVDHVWDAVSQAFALAPVVKKFIATVDHSQFTPGYVNGMKICLEMFAQDVAA
jgi:hypothetical protein